MKGKMCVLIVIIVVMGLSMYVKGDDSHIIKVVPSEKTVGVGEKFNISVNIVPSSNVSSAFCNLSFDPHVLQAIKIENGGMFDLWLGDLEGVAEIDNVTGKITYIMAASSQPQSEEGTFFVVTFQAVAAGVSNISILDPIVQGSHDVNVINGTVTVTEEGDFTPPDIHLIDYPDAVIESRNVLFEWNATDNVSPEENITFSYMLSPYDGGWSPWGYTTLTSYNDLNAGSYTFRIRAKDDAGNIGYLNYSFQIQDNEPPHISSININPSTQAVNEEVNISCIITDNFGVNEAKVVITYPDASVHEFMLQHNSKYYLAQPYSIEGTYAFYIYARDVNGNVETSSPYQFTMVAGDFVPPSITDVSVTPALQDVGKNVTISCMVTDNIALQDVRLNISYPDGSYENFSIFNNKTGDIYYCIKPYTMMGEYSFYVYAIDVSGNGNESQEKQFSISDLSSPSIGNILVVPTIQDIGKHVNISVVVEDNVEVQDVRIHISYPDGSEENFSILQNRTDHTYYCNRTYSAEGEYTFYIYAIDSSNNTNVSQENNFNIEDRTPPTVEITYPQEGDIVRGSVKIKWNATDESGSVDITLKYSPNNGQTWTLIVEHTSNDGEYLWNVSNLTDGSEYVLQIIAVDASGNTARYFTEPFTIDNTAPSLDITKPGAGKLYMFDREILPIIGNKAIIIGKITIQADATDSSGIDKVEFYVDGSYKSEDTTSPYEWAWSEKTIGKHTIKVIAYDKAGNKISEEREVFAINPL